ncbi:28S ribosomal protein S18c, mitochondrial [Daphnia magna]|uniref:Uncharacterized protein n=2 Tax=Daphnia magna TaxID=35525 RepID=A0ABQ9ZPJ0_9CRUS|nr:28S ribosomal protein S18c, mitochondrial [Daphnia magna]KAK4014708.1 hypothetical protein OUZ56_027217 [Daphnia magna]KZS13605.1 28S ribosomal protein S18c [Daphnia magna]
MSILRKVFSDFHVSNFYRITGSKLLPVRVGYSTASSTSSQPEDDLPAENLSNPYQKEKRCCVLCKYGVEVDYKNARLLSQFLSPFTGKVYEKNITGLCKAKQKSVEREIIKSQNAGYLAVMLKKVEYIRDPKLCDPSRPIRPHRY